MKSDIKREAGLREIELSWIGENEVFETDFVSKVFVDLLNGKCRVWDVMEYDGKTGMGAHDYYTRARYEIGSVVLFVTPPNRKGLTRQFLHG